MIFFLLMIPVFFLGDILQIETAVTAVEKRTGLMYRKSWDQTDGMIFVYDKPCRVSFWMKNTYLEMAILYISSDFAIQEVYYPETLSEIPLTSRSENIRYVLEVQPETGTNISRYPEKFQKNLSNSLSTNLSHK